MKLYTTHSSWIEGAQAFGERLAGVKGVNYVNAGNIRTSHVAPGKREPKIVITKHSIRVEYFSNGSMQCFFVFPLPGITFKGLTRKIRKVVRESNERGGIGESSKSEIKIPERIRRRQEMEMDQAKEPVSAMAVSSEQPIRFSPLQAEAYQFLLSLAPSPETGKFNITGAIGKLLQKFGTNASSLAITLTKKGVLIRQQQAKKGTRKVFEIIRRPFVADESLRGPRLRSKREVKPGKKEIQKMPPVSCGDEKGPVLGHIEVIEKHIALLFGLGFKVQIDNGEVVLRKAKK